MYRQYGDKATFVAVYIREAHPTDEWQMESNEKEGVCYPQPKSTAQRVAIANDFIRRFHVAALARGSERPLPQRGHDDVATALVH